MKVAIMQPYVFPYTGYFQLIHSADKFIVYDDVAFIKQGWINRNRILVNNEAHLFTVPVSDISSFTSIRNTALDQKLFQKFRGKFLKTIQTSYKKAPFFTEGMQLFENVFFSDHENISSLALASIQQCCAYIGMSTLIESSPEKYCNNVLKAAERVIDICRQEKATDYINVSGGKELYDKKVFKDAGIDLHFIQSLPIQYKQFNDNFVPGLSIIDLVMFNAPEQINRFLKQYNLD